MHFRSTMLAVATTILVAQGALAAFQEQDATPEAVHASPDAEEIYDALREIGFNAAGALRLDHVELTRGPATFVFESGVWIPLAAVDDVVTGAVFLGEGTLRYQPPEGVEQDQLEKYTDETQLEEKFEEVYLRFSDATAELFQASLGTVSDESATRSSVVVQAADRRLVKDAEDLHEDVNEHFLEKEFFNLDARLLAELVDGGDEFFTAWIDTKDDGPLHFTQDPTAFDRYSLRGWHNRGRAFDIWGGFGEVNEPAARPVHYTMDITIDGEEIEPARVTLEFQADVGARVVRFAVHPLVEITEVVDGDEVPLFFVSEHVDGKDHEQGVTVVFADDLPTDSTSTVTFVYTGDLVDRGLRDFALKAPDSWYPKLGYMLRATYDMTFRLDDKYKVYAAGVRLSDEVEDDLRVARFEQVLPVAFTSFNYGTMREREVIVEGAPPIVVFGEARGLGGDALGNVGADVANALLLFEELFGDYPFSYMSATRIPYAHGQGFPGLLHLAAESFGNERRGHTEAFRGHETSHQWWGHVVGWKTYRDQWMSEGFAEYSGALYASLYLDDTELLERMTEAWRKDIFKKGNLGFDRYGLPVEVMRFSDGSESGPVTLGYRLKSAETPYDYRILAYEKGAYILHMLRMMMYDFDTNIAEPFRAMMRDFVAGHAGGEATNASFRAVVEKHFGDDMGWFFDQWVEGTALPTYRWAWKHERTIDGQRFLRIRVRQSVEPEVPFKMYIPIMVEFEGGTKSVVKVLVDESYEEFRFPMGGAMVPVTLTFNPLNAVLAEIAQEDW